MTGEWIQEVLGAERLDEDKLADLLNPEIGQTPVEIGPAFSTRARLTQVSPRPAILSVEQDSQRTILVQRGLFSDSVAQSLEQSKLGTVRWLDPGQDPMIQLKALKTMLDSGELKHSPGDPKTVLLVDSLMADELKGRLSELNIDVGWELPVIILGISEGALRPANLPEIPIDPKTVLAYLRDLFSWGDLLPGRIVEQLKGTFLDNQYQTRFLSIAA